MGLDLSGVNPATVVPFSEAGETVDEPSLRRHVRTLADVKRVNGLVVNGHAGEVYALDCDERVRVTEVVTEETADATPVVSGVVAGSTRRVIEDVHRMAAAGADGILVVPPHTPLADADAARTFFEDVAAAVDLPLVIFQHPYWAGGHYDPETLGELVTVEGVTAVKDAVWDVDHYQDDLRAIRDSGANVQVLVANDEHLLPSYSLGADGTILELAAVIPELVIDLFDAVENSNLESARETYDRMEPFVNAVYESPVTNSHTRLKVALEIQGVIERSDPRPPARPIDDDECAGIERAMRESGLD